MKKFSFLIILFVAAFIGYIIRVNSINKFDSIRNDELANIAAQAQAQVKQQIAEENEKKARELTKAALSKMNYDAANGEKCTENCQDANAGFEWAKSQDFNEQSDCGGKTEAYKDGCQVYVDKYDNLLDENKEKLEAAAETPPAPSTTNQTQ